MKNITAPPHVETILRALEARPAGPDRWRARCSAHGGKSTQTLSLGLGTDGRILLHCFKGCAPGDVLAAAGLSWGDAFGDGPKSQPSLTRLAERSTEEVIDAQLHRARLTASRTLVQLHRLIPQTSQFIQSSESHGVDVPSLYERLGDLILLREDLSREMTELDSRDRIEAIQALLRLRQRGRNVE